MHKLINKIDNDVWNILKKYYDLNYGIIKDDNELNLFQIMCGVKQGGILSPYLFNFYINEVLNKCEQSGIGAQFEKIRTNII